MDVDCILFDLDGTLADTNADLTAAMNYMLKEFDAPPLKPEQVKVLLGCGVHNLVSRSFENSTGRTLVGDELERAVKINLAYYAEHIADLTTPFPGVVETLEYCKKRNIKMAVVTNKSTRPSQQIVDAIGLTPYMLAVQGDGDNLPLKPNPDLLWHVMKKLNADAEKTLMVGDNYTDIGAARNAGVKGVFIQDGYGVIGDEKADYVIDTFANLKELIS